MDRHDHADLDLCGHVATTQVALVLLDIPCTVGVYHSELLLGMFLTKLFLEALDVLSAIRAHSTQGIPFVGEFLGSKRIE